MNALTTDFNGLPFMGQAVASVQENTAKGGVAQGTLIETDRGLRPVEALQAGDYVRTFDNGWQPVLEIRRSALGAGFGTADHEDLPLNIPAGTLGNCRDMTVMADQGLMVGSENACDVMGDPFAVIPVRALEGLCGISRSAPAQQTELFILVFAADEVIFADGGQLLHFEAEYSDPQRPSYSVKTSDQAAEMLTDLDLAVLFLEDERNEVLSRGRMARVA